MCSRMISHQLCSKGDTRIPFSLLPKDSRQPKLYPSFCGFNEAIGFKATFALEEEITRNLIHSDIRHILKIHDHNERVESAVDLYYRHVKFLAQNRVVDVIMCIL